LLLLLLDLLLAHLHFLHHLLGCASWSAGVAGKAGLGLRLGLVHGLVVDDDFVVAAFNVLGLGRLRGSCCGAAGGGEDELAGRTGALLADHEDVVAGALEELGKDGAGWGGAVVAEDALVGGEALDFEAGCGGDGVEDLFEAGVGGANGEGAAVELDLSGMRFREGGPIGLGWLGRGKLFLGSDGSGLGLVGGAMVGGFGSLRMSGWGGRLRPERRSGREQAEEGRGAEYEVAGA